MLHRPFRPLSRRLLTLNRPPNRLDSPRRTLVAPPKPNSGPLMSRRADRELPPIASSRRWMFSIPLFCLTMAGCAVAMFNYQKLNSSVISSTLYALRTNAEAREALGDQIYFASKVPWVWGTIDQLHGRIDVEFGVKGTRQRGMMRFKSERKTRMGFFRTTEWSLKLDDGRVLQLLQADQPDPFMANEASEAAQL